jgi:hypothetical protein
LESKIARQPVVAALADKAKDKLGIPWQKLEVLTKYQTNLDNQLYKTIKALREEQARRINKMVIIESASVEGA